MAETSITVRLDESEKETFSKITDNMNLSNQEVLESFIENVNERFKIITTMDEDSVKQSINEAIYTLKEEDLVETEAPISELPEKGKLSFLAWFLRNLHFMENKEFVESYQQLKDKYPRLPSRGEVFLSGSQIHLLSHISLKDALEVDKEALYDGESSPISTSIRFLVILAKRIISQKPELVLDAAEREWGEKQKVYLEDEDVRAETVTGNNKKLQFELVLPYDGVENREKSS